MRSLKFQLLLESHCLLFIKFYLELISFGIRMKLLLRFIALIPLLSPTNAYSGVSGEMQVEERIKGLVSVAQLSEGDVIRGITGTDQTPDWCRVEAVIPLSQDQTTYDGFTENHIVVDDSGSVHPYGTKGKLREGPVFTLVTECDAAVNSAGQAFTPLNTLLCPIELSWDEYLPLIAAVRQAMLLTDNFWYSLNEYHDNETAGVLDWSDHDVCSELVECTRKGRTQCKTFEEVMERFVRDHLNKKHVKNVEQAFPDMSDNDTDDITELHSTGRRNRMLLLSSIGTAMVLIVLILLVGLLIYYRRMAKRKEEKKTELGDSLTKAGEIKA